MRYLKKALFGLGVLCAGLSSGSLSAQSPLQLGLPINCQLGEDCWLVNLVDLDPGPGVKDFQCQSQSYDGHKGTDFAIRDLKVMQRGVQVIASAAGVVRGIRNDMPDEDVSIVGTHKVKGRECGNGVVIAHPEGWETQYCHLRKGSVVVKKDDHVRKGQKIGFVGHSGRAGFPHVHLSVRRNRQIQDPFVGANPGTTCQMSNQPLWDETSRAAVSAPLTAIYNAGFADVKPKISGIHAGHYQDKGFLKNAPALVLWAAIYNVRAGDLVRMRIFDTEGELLHAHESTLKKDQATRILYSGKKRKTLFWPEGKYTGDITLTRKSTKGPEQVFRVEREILLR